MPYFPVIMAVMYMARLRSGHDDIDRYSPEAYLPSARTPVFIIAAESDGIMPPADVRRLYDAARGRDAVRLTLGDETAIDAVRAFLNA